MNWRLIQCLREGLPLDLTVYDAAAWSSIVPAEHRLRREWQRAGGRARFHPRRLEETSPGPPRRGHAVTDSVLDRSCTAGAFLRHSHHEH